MNRFFLLIVLCCYLQSLHAQLQPTKVVKASGQKNIYHVTFFMDEQFIMGIQGKFVTSWNPENSKYGLFTEGKYFAISPDNRSFLVSKGTGVSKFSFLPNPTSSPLNLEPTPSVNSIAFTPDGRLFVTGGKDKTIRLWDITDGTLVKTFTGHSQAISRVIVSPNGAYIASSSVDGIIKVWELANSNNILTINVENEPAAFSFTPDSKYIWSIAQNANLNKWRISTGDLIKSIPITSRFNAYIGAFSEDGNLAITFGGRNSLWLWDLNGGRVVDSLSCTAILTNSVAFSKSGRYVVAGTGDYTDSNQSYADEKVKIWDVSDWTEKARKWIPTETTDEQTPQSINPLVTLPAKQTTRYALVIGNSSYSNGTSLENIPVNDAQDVSKRLKELGFDVTLLVNASKNELIRTIKQFARKTKQNEATVFFYAGHGIEAEGNNYIIPIDAQMNDKKDAVSQAVSLDMVINEVESMHSKTNLFFLDACRNNPFRSWLRGNDQNLAPVSPSFSAFRIHYATLSGAFAHNGMGRNGVYTSALLQYLQKGVEVGTLLRNVNRKVLETTNGVQRPWSAGSLISNFVF